MKKGKIKMKKVLLITAVSASAVLVIASVCLKHFSKKLLTGDSEKYLDMTYDELSALSDEELYEAVTDRIENKFRGYETLEEDFNSLSEPEKIVYSLNEMIMEIENGGLCQFFSNSSNMVAPFVSDYMEIVGAEKHKKLYDSFVSENNINLSDLSYFEDADIDDFAKINNSYPFDEFDEKFYETEPLEAYVTKYIRSHIGDF